MKLCYSVRMLDPVAINVIIGVIRGVLLFIIVSLITDNDFDFWVVLVAFIALFSISDFV